MLPTQVIVKPLTTEKTSRMEKEGIYTFFVNKDATKSDVKRAVSVLYGATAVKVNMLSRKPKTRVVGRGKLVTKRSAMKKAIVTLKGRKVIDVYKVKEK